jgi:heme-degrading monooxygenase HmoA
MKSNYTFFVTLEAVSESAGKELEAAMEEKNNTLNSNVPGFVSLQRFAGAGQDGPRHLIIHRWENETAMNNWRGAQSDCPVGKLIETGKVRFNGGPVNQLQ